VTALTTDAAKEAIRQSDLFSSYIQNASKLHGPALEKVSSDLLLYHSERDPSAEMLLILELELKLVLKSYNLVHLCYRRHCSSSFLVISIAKTICNV
jgi:hypothetical protein